MQAQKETEVSFLIAQSELDLSNGNVEHALAQAASAFKSLPSTASRSALLQALIEISPNVTTVIPLGTDTGEALAWASGERLDIATGSGRLRTFDLSKPAEPLGGWALPLIKRPQDGNRSVVRALSPLGTARMIAVFDEGSVGVYRRGANVMRVQAPNQDISVNPTQHAVAIGRSGALIALATTDETIMLYRCEWSAPRRVASPCESAPLGDAHGRAVAISPDEKRIAVGDQAGKVTVYNVSGNPIGNSESLNGAIIALGWAEQRDWLAAGTITGEINVLDASVLHASVEQMPIVEKQKFGDRPVAALAWSPKELGLAFVCNGTAVCLWRANAGADPRQPFKPAMRFEGHRNSVTRLSFAPTGAELASGAADGTIRIWSLAQDTDATFAFFGDEVAEFTTVAVSPDRRWVASGSSDGAIQLWDAKTGAPDRIVSPAGDFEVRDLAWNRRGAVASINENDTVNVISTDVRGPALTIPIKTRVGYHLTWADEDRMIAVPMGDSGVILLDSRSPGSEPVRIGAADRKDEAWGVAAIPGSRLLAVSYVGGEIRIWDLTSRQAVGSMHNGQTEQPNRIGVGSLSVSPDGRLLATSSGDRFVTVYDLAKRATWRLLKTDADGILTVAFSPDGQKLAALGSNNRLYVWNSRPK